MSLPEKKLRQAFRKTPLVAARVTPRGFAFHDQVVPHLEGRVVRARLVRKLFRESVLACFSPDGVRARGGTLCDVCRHPRCQPQMRLDLRERHAVFVLDLAYSSARNLIALLDELDEEGTDIETIPLRLSVLDRGKWGEVVFTRVDEPRSESDDRHPGATSKPAAEPDDGPPSERGC